MTLARPRSTCVYADAWRTHTSLSVSQKIDAEPPRQMPPAVARLRGDFVFRSEDGPEAAPPHRRLARVPRLHRPARRSAAVRAHSAGLAEDAGFYGHRGIDLRELPAALLTNWSRGGAALVYRQSPQQLAKNLFLSRDKQLGRKLQELAIPFLLQGGLGKDRILEIYLNISSSSGRDRTSRSAWRPAARRYFGREPPRADAGAEMAFLVAIIPGPIKCQSSFAHGTPGAWAAFADRRAAGEAAVGGCDRRGGI